MTDLLRGQNRPRGGDLLPGVRRAGIRRASRRNDWERMKRALVCLIVVLALAATGPAHAAAPILISVGHVQRHPEATWSLPPGGDAWTLEIATHPETGSNGSFFEENRVAFEILTRTQTHFLGTERLDVGTYYVHVSSFNSACEPRASSGRRSSSSRSSAHLHCPRATRPRCAQLTRAPSTTVVETGPISATPYESPFETPRLGSVRDGLTKSATRGTGGSLAQTAR
jgi:hypothetical protein